MIIGQLVNIWLSVGSAIAAQTYPGLELTASANCSSSVDPQLLATEMLPANLDFDLFSTNASSYQPANRGEFGDIYRLSYNLYPIVGFLLTTMTCIFASIATGGLSQMKKVDRRLVNPFMWKLFGLNDEKVERK